MASASRAVVMDKAVSEFIAKNGECNVVCIGCGLETMAWRIENSAQNAHFYEVDFPDVIENRKKILGIRENETLIGGNANELNFAKLINLALPCSLANSTQPFVKPFFANK